MEASFARPGNKAPRGEHGGGEACVKVKESWSCCRRFRPLLHWSQMERFQMEPIQNWYEWALRLHQNRWNRYQCSFGSAEGTAPFGTVRFIFSVSRQNEVNGAKRVPNTEENWIFEI